MHLTLGASLLTVASVLPALAYTPESTVKSDTVCADSLKKLTASVLDGSLKTLLARKGVKQECDLGKVAIRREYSTLSNQQKLDYTRSVKCLMDKPSKIPPGLAPGAKSRYDDFVAIHVNQTEIIHDTGNFLAWHRYYLYAFERALRDECGYNGYVPYWNWAKSAKDVLNAPYFDGSEYSQGGNGVWEPHSCTRANPNATCLAPVVEGRGGGCVETGPYAGYQANLSAVNVWFNTPNEPVGPLLSYQPRCIKRDISPDIAVQNSDDLLYDLMMNPFNDHIGRFQRSLQQKGGPHPLGHFTWSGNPGGDVYVSPNDPMFWLLHGGVDRAWACWQNQDIAERMFQINSTRTQANIPPSSNATIDDLLWLDYLTPAGDPIGGDPIRNHVSTVGGPYCYVYVDDKTCKPKRRRAF